jgi:acetyltransferase EpsM
MVLFGAGGHAKVILDILRLMKVEVTKIVDDKEIEIQGFNVEKPDFSEIRDRIIIGVGNNNTRKYIVENCNLLFGKAIHPNSIIDPTVKLEEGTVVMAGAIINSSTKIAKHCIINTSASIDHDCILEDFVHISPNATLCGNVNIGEGTHIGAGATIIPGIKIGKWSTIGAGSVVVKDVEDGVTVVGNPARITKK